MSIERGFKRIVLLISVVGGLSMAVYATLETQAVIGYKEYKATHARREASFQAWLKQHPISAQQVEEWRKKREEGERYLGLPRERPRAMSDFERAVKQDEYRFEVESEFRWEHARREGLEAFVMPPDQHGPWSKWAREYPRLAWDWPLYQFVLAAVGAVIAVALAPWIVFWIARWLARGFQT